MMWYDLLMVGMLLVAVVRGAMRGFIWQVAAIAAIVLCFGFAGTLADSLAPMIPGVEPPLNRWLAMLALYLGFSFISFGIARMLREWMEKIRFVEYDRHLGAVFGFVKGVAFCLVVTFFVITLSDSVRQQVLASQSGHASAIIMDRLHPVMPEKLHEVLEQYIHQLDQPGMNLLYGHDHDAEGGEHNAHSSAGNGSHGPQPTIDQTLLDLAARFPSIFDQELQQMARQALENTNPSDRGELIQKLESGLPGLIRAITRDWQQGRPDDSTELNADRTRLMREIAAVYSDFPEAQSVIVEDIEMSLSGLPDQVALATLGDWHADLLVPDADPDPQTDSTAMLDYRILRQLSLAGIFVDSLEAALQSRLNGWSPR